MKCVSPAPPAALVARVLGARDPTQNQNRQQTRHERREHVCPGAVCLFPAARNYIDLLHRHQIKQSNVGVFTTSCFLQYRLTLYGRNLLKSRKSGTRVHSLHVALSEQLYLSGVKTAVTRWGIRVEPLTELWRPRMRIEGLLFCCWAILLLGLFGFSRLLMEEIQLLPEVLQNLAI